jgi:hypothetical protein
MYLKAPSYNLVALNERTGRKAYLTRYPLDPSPLNNTIPEQSYQE